MNELLNAKNDGGGTPAPYCIWLLGTDKLRVIKHVVYVWVGLMALVLSVHTIRLIVKVVKKQRKTLRKRRRVAGLTVLVNNVGV
ncbi:hypothetical protein CDL12_19991 [Handroanthus impetiginosus]|uniref:Uncharacterized protein n=1 Tax=Handroanthus impetiginosus TaxID=429701 RepID=A0A2G9GQ50_9LAMI|nr:hypothetical protein CDL12_19991 [Handroanthus impetiginosus]